MKANRKNFKFNDDTVHRLSRIAEVTGKSETAIVEAAIQFIHGEYLRFSKGVDYDDLAIDQVMGNFTVTEEEAV